MKVVLNFAASSLLLLLFFGHAALAGDFAQSLAQADAAKKRGDLQGALAIYDAAQRSQAGNASNLCMLAHCYCDLTYLTNSMAVQKDLVARALACAQLAVKDDPANAIAHASIAVCYAKSCNFVDIKTELAYSSLFKREAEKAIALDPRQDIAYYLLGRWNYGIASAGILARAYVKIVYGGLPQASFQDALLNFKRACALAPNRILNHAGQAMVYEAIGEKKLEREELEKCCALKPLGPEDNEALRDAQKKLAALGS
jgi:hypothetical protein